jgi:hypothetical protein
MKTEAISPRFGNAIKKQENSHKFPKSNTTYANLSVSIYPVYPDFPYYTECIPEIRVCAYAKAMDERRHRQRRGSGMMPMQTLTPINTYTGQKREPYESGISATLGIYLHNRVVKRWIPKFVNEWRPATKREYCIHQQGARANIVGCDY